MLPSVTTHSSFTKSVVMSIAVSKVGVVLCRASSEKSCKCHDFDCNCSGFIADGAVVHYNDV